MHGDHYQKLECALYVVATPIGNMGDVTLRALDVLARVDAIAAEDTRTTQHLLAHHGISGARLLALHRHNERSAAETVLDKLSSGQSVALVSDAGTPAISDPGAKLVADVRKGGFRVIPIPGANAAVAAMSASGFENPHFLFIGFLPAKMAARRSMLQEFSTQAATLVFYESPHRVLESVSDMNAVLGPHRRIIFARELTKLFESIHECDLGKAENWLNSDTNNVRGEFVLLVSGMPPAEDAGQAAAERMVDILLTQLPLRQAVQLAHQISGFSRNILYEYALTHQPEK